MNTPAHALVNLLILDRRGRSDNLLPVAIGSVLPDVPIVVFYAVQRLAGRSEHAIWSTHYHDAGWQAVFDAFHALPLIALAWIAGRLLGWHWLQWLAAGMALHAVFDLPLHHGDAHRHFFPLSDWRFSSPVSYWDPAHYGRLASLAEAALSGFAVAWLWLRHPGTGPRLLVAALAAAYAAHWLFVFSVWA